MIVQGYINETFDIGYPFENQSYNIIDLQNKTFENKTSDDFITHDDNTLTFGMFCFGIFFLFLSMFGAGCKCRNSY